MKKEEMAFFDSKKSTELYVDAGPYGCSSFLTQEDKINKTIKFVRVNEHTAITEPLLPSPIPDSPWQ